MKRILIAVVAAFVVLLVGAMVWVRSLGHDAATWHVDPTTAPDPRSPNWYKVEPDGPNPAPVFDHAADDLSAALDRVVAGQPRIELLQDDRASSGPVSWVQTSAVFGFPDYVSIKVIPLGEGQSTLAVFSRARLGVSDLGVNEKRVEAWLAELDRQLGS